MIPWLGRIPRTPICCDTFGASARRVTDECTSGINLVYFLSHLHSDHTSGLNASWNFGRIFCSPISRTLLLDQYAGIDPQLIIALPVGETSLIPLARLVTTPISPRYEPEPATAAVAGAGTTPTTSSVAGLLLKDDKSAIEAMAKPILGAAPPSSLSSAAGATCDGGELMSVTVLDARNHCPGAVMFLFAGYFGRILYTGDFRYELDDKPIPRPISAPATAAAPLLPALCPLLSALDHPAIARPLKSAAAASAASVDPRLTAIDACYLDNTFAHPQYRSFLSVPATVRQIVSIISQFPVGTAVLLGVGADRLGKEALYIQLSYELNTMIVVSEDRFRTLALLAGEGYDILPPPIDQMAEGEHRNGTRDDKELDDYVKRFQAPNWFDVFTTDPTKGFVHVVNKREVTDKKIAWRNSQLSRQRRTTNLTGAASSANSSVSVSGCIGIVLMGWATAVSGDDSSAAAKASASAAASASAGGAVSSAVVPVELSAAGNARLSRMDSSPAVESLTTHSSPSADVAFVAVCKASDKRVYRLPYSSHSSYSELRAFVARVRPRALVMTVKNVDQSAMAVPVTQLFVPYLDPTPSAPFSVPASLKLSAADSPFNRDRTAAAAAATTTAIVSAAHNTSLPPFVRRRLLGTGAKIGVATTEDDLFAIKQCLAKVKSQGASAAASNAVPAAVAADSAPLIALKRGDSKPPVRMTTGTSPELTAAAGLASSAPPFSAAGVKLAVTSKPAKAAAAGGGGGGGSTARVAFDCEPPSVITIPDDHSLSLGSGFGSQEGIISTPSDCDESPISSSTTTSQRRRSILSTVLQADSDAVMAAAAAPAVAGSEQTSKPNPAASASTCNAIAAAKRKRTASVDLTSSNPLSAAPIVVEIADTPPAAVASADDMATAKKRRRELPASMIKPIKPIKPIRSAAAAPAATTPTSVSAAPLPPAAAAAGTSAGAEPKTKPKPIAKVGASGTLALAGASRGRAGSPNPKPQKKPARGIVPLSPPPGASRDAASDSISFSGHYLNPAYAASAAAASAFAGTVPFRQTQFPAAKRASKPKPATAAAPPPQPVEPVSSLQAVAAPPRVRSGLHVSSLARRLIVRDVARTAAAAAAATAASLTYRPATTSTEARQLVRPPNSGGVRIISNPFGRPPEPAKVDSRSNLTAAFHSIDVSKENTPPLDE